MNIKVLSLVSLLALGTGIGALGIQKVQPNVADAVADTSKVRVYAFLAGDWDYGNSYHDMFIHYWGGNTGTSWSTCPKMTRVLDDYYKGLYYYDVPSDVTQCLFKDATGNTISNKSSNQSANIYLSKLKSGENYYAAEIGAWKSDSASRVVTFKNLPMSGAQFAASLSYIHYDTCAENSANGYLAYPQVKSLMADPTDKLGFSTVVNASATEKTTIAQKLAKMEQMYNKSQNPVSALLFTDNLKDIAFPVVITVSALIAITSFFAISTAKKKHN